MMVMQNKWGTLLQTTLENPPALRNWWRPFEDRASGAFVPLRIESSSVTQPRGQRTRHDLKSKIDAAIQDLLAEQNLPEMPSNLRAQIIAQAPSSPTDRANLPADDPGDLEGPNGKGPRTR